MNQFFIFHPSLRYMNKIIEKNQNITKLQIHPVFTWILRANCAHLAVLNYEPDLDRVLEQPMYCVRGCREQELIGECLWMGVRPVVGAPQKPRIKSLVSLPRPWGAWLSSFIKSKSSSNCLVSEPVTALIDWTSLTAAGTNDVPVIIAPSNYESHP